MITDNQWSDFVRRISERIATEPEFSILRDTVAERFGFQTPLFAELNKRARDTDLSFVFTGTHWYLDGDPSQMLFFQRGRPVRGTSAP
jgi:hypothetical protein